MKVMDKTAERIFRGGDAPGNNKVDPRRALQDIWPLSQQVFSLSGKYDVQSSLQRSVETILRTSR